MSVTSHEVACPATGVELGRRVDDSAAARRARVAARRSQLRVVPEPQDSSVFAPRSAASVWDLPAAFGYPLTDGSSALAPSPVHVPPAPLGQRATPVLAPTPEPSAELARMDELARLVTAAPTQAEVSGASPASAPAPTRVRRTAHLEQARPVRPAKYRLTLRGQRVVLAAGFMLAIGVGALTGTIINALTPAHETSVVTVQQGDSLWSIAGAVAGPGADLRPVVDEITALNDLASSTIVAGQSLVVPAP